MSVPSWCRHLCLTSFQVSPLFHKSLKICRSISSRYHLTPIQVWRGNAHPYLCPISFPSTSHISHPSRSYLTSMLVLMCVSHLNPCDVTATSSSTKIASQLHPSTISNILNLFNVLCMCLTYIPILYQLHPGHKLIV